MIDSLLGYLDQREQDTGIAFGLVGGLSTQVATSRSFHRNRLTELGVWPVHPWADA